MLNGYLKYKWDFKNCTTVLYHYATSDKKNKAPTQQWLSSGGLITLGLRLCFRFSESSFSAFSVLLSSFVVIALFLRDDKSDSTNYDDCDSCNHADRRSVFRIDRNSRSLSGFGGCGFFRTNTVRCSTRARDRSDSADGRSCLEITVSTYTPGRPGTFGLLGLSFGTWFGSGVVEGVGSGLWSGVGNRGLPSSLLITSLVLPGIVGVFSGGLFSPVWSSGW